MRLKRRQAVPTPASWHNLLARRDPIDITTHSALALLRPMGVSWDEVLPACFGSLAVTAEPNDYAQTVTGMVDDFARYNRDKFQRKVRGVANTAQKKARQ